MGYLFNVALYGCLSVQACKRGFESSETCYSLVICLCSLVDLYYLSFPKDPRVAKCLVSWLYVLETVQTIVVFHDAFVTYGRDFGNIGALNDINLGWFNVPILSSLGLLFF